MDATFFRGCNLSIHDPFLPLPTAEEILRRLEDPFGHGISQAEVGYLLCRCASCERFICVESRSRHECDGAPCGDFTTPGFSWVSACRLTYEHRGFSLEDLAFVLTVCPQCEHIVLKESFVLHMC